MRNLLLRCDGTAATAWLFEQAVLPLAIATMAACTNGQLPVRRLVVVARGPVHKRGSHHECGQLECGGVGVCECVRVFVVQASHKKAQS